MGVAIRRARQEDREIVARLLDEAFLEDPVTLWLFPDEADRRAKNATMMVAFLDQTLHDGRVDMTEDGAAAALWIWVPTGHPCDEDGPALIRQAVDPGNERIELVGRLVDAAHPRRRAHEYLQLVAVAPDRQGEGLGGALIRATLDRCDRERQPVYLEASTERSRGLYERLGFMDMGYTLVLPDGPAMWPMWRDPQ
ncbi:GNAT family N-acetyltransferase [Streptomyces odontomachi]|uniref:GNAT family N-acetyltransferase n=1 Tax=Streptomyces odontomachi TaxID=2944940 RepID=UPI00210CB7F5|nr:GNAT family N-acetyltransferase [Streptomyces sp. ODS25]